MSADLDGKTFTAEDGTTWRVIGTWRVLPTYVLVFDGHAREELRPASVIRRRLQLDGAL